MRLLPAGRAAGPIVPLALTLLALSQSPEARAGVDRWTEIGLPGAHLGAVSVHPLDPRTVYASGTSGQYVSRDGGESWHRLRGLPLGSGARIHLDPGPPTVLYAAGDSLRRSLDGGASWQALDHPTGFVCSFAVAPTQPRTLYAVIEPPASSLAELYRSLDGGLSWQQVFSDVRCTLGAHLLVDPNDSESVYVWWREAVYKTADGGTTWTALEGLGLPSGETLIHDLAAPASTPGALVAMARTLPLGSRLWVSADGGSSWSPEAELPFPVCQWLAVHPEEPSRLYAGCGDGRAYRTADLGSTWQEALGLRGAAAISVDPEDGSRLYAASADGVYRSLDTGRTWSLSSRGLRAAMHSPYLVPSDPLGLIVETGRCHLLASGNLGESWHRVPGPPGCSEPLNLRAVSRTDPDSLYVEAEDHLFVTVDGGSRWEELGRFAGGPLAVSPADPTLFVAGALGLQRSDDRGRTWEQVVPAGIDDEDLIPLTIQFDPVDPQTVYADIVHSNSLLGIAEVHLWISRDAGAQWEDTAPVFDLVVVPGAPSELFGQWVSTSGPFVRSVDGGISWQVLEVPGDHLRVVPSDPPVLYSDGPQGVLMSRDRGATWSPVPGWDELQPHTYVRHLIYPLAPERIIAWPTIAGGVFRASFANAEPLSLQDGRIEVRAAWRDGRGRAGTGRPHSIQGDSGALWFFRPGNLELVLKVLDGRAVNGRFWSFAAALSGVEYEVTVLDTATGQDVTWLHPRGAPASRTDSGSLLEILPRSGPPPAGGPHAITPGGTGPANGGDLLFGEGRFRATVSWQIPAGGQGSGQPVPLTPDSGAFWFFRPGNLELAVKLLDGRAVNGHFWVFVGALSNVRYTLRITDSETGAQWVYENPAGELASLADTAAFPG